MWQDTVQGILLSQGSTGVFHTRSDLERAVGTQSSYTHNNRRHYAIETTGTFSIWDNQIEFTLSDGRVEVFEFSRTENTFTIDDKRYIRQR